MEPLVTRKVTEVTGETAEAGNSTTINVIE
jgi:hypothetical protein